MMRFMNILSLALAIALLPINVALGADAPVYKDGLLTIPSVNTAGQVGQYQDVTFKLTEQGNWQLSSFKAIGTVIGELDLRLVPINKVEVVKTDTFPTQVFLRLSGGLGGCFNNTLGQINQRLENNRFDVVVTTSYFVYPYVPGVCPAFSTPFVKTISLAVYGLSAGIYSYNVNGTTGTFELTADNKYPGDY
ncbi:MAG: hypothetical protein ACYC2R_14950 [Burkholderiales bacterium]